MNLSEEKAKWLETRRKTITDYFEVPAAMQAEVDKVFADMAEIADRSAHQGEFEKELLDSPVNTAYNNLFTKLASHSKQKFGPSTGDFKKNLATNIVASSIKTQVRNGIRGWLVRILPSWITDWWIYREYNIPGVREVKSALNQHAQFAGRVQRGYKEAQELERLEKENEQFQEQQKQQQEEADRKVKEMQEAAKQAMRDS